MSAGRPQAAAEEAIRGLVASQLRAIHDKDPAAIMAPLAPDLLSFDVVAPLRNRGAEAVRQRLDGWLAAYDGPIRSEIRELEISVGGDLAFCHGLQRFAGTLTGGAEVDMWVRVTYCLRKQGGRWLIAHQHLSEPFDPGSGQALLDLQP